MIADIKIKSHIHVARWRRMYMKCVFYFSPSQSKF